MRKVFARFPNESFYDEILIDMDEFKILNEFENEIFGLYKSIHIFIKK